MNNRLLGALLGVLIGVILIGSVLAPVIFDSDREFKEVQSNTDGLSYIMLNESSDTVNVSFTHATSTLNVDGVEYVNDEESGFTYGAVIYSDTFYVMGGSNFGFTFWSPDATAAYPYNDWTLTISGGTYTFNHSVSGTFTGTYDFCYVANPDGDYASYLLRDGAKLRVDAGDTIAYVKLQAHYGVNLISSMQVVGGNAVGAVYVLEDGAWVKYDANISVEKVRSSDGYYEVGTGTAEYDGKSIVVDSFIAPRTYHTVVESDRPAHTLLMAIPPLMILAVLVVFLSMVFREY